MTAVQGIDISRWQEGQIDFSKVKAAGYSFVIIRAGYGNALAYPSQFDPQFDEWYTQAKAAGLGVGAYWYSYADSPEAAEQEAASLLSRLKGKKLSYPVFYDVEEKSQFDKGTAFCDSIITAFLDKTEKAGWFSGLYCSTGWIEACVSPAVRERYTCWIADYRGRCGYTGSYGMWQDGAVDVPGIKSGKTDHDWCYTDYPKLIRSKGLNGYKKSGAAPSDKPEDDKRILDTGSCYKPGETTVGALAVKELLRLAYDKRLIRIRVNDTKVYDEQTVKAVKALQKRWGYEQTGGAGENFVRKLYSALR